MFTSVRDCKLISGQTPFGYNTNAFEKCDISKIQTDRYSVKLIGSKGRYAWVQPGDISNNYNWLRYYKVALNQAMSGGCRTDSNGRSQVLSTPFVLLPNEICTQTYLIAGISDSEEIAKNIIKYYKTKFVRALILSTLTSKSLNPDSFQFVPIQNFKSESDIDWTQSVEDIDKQLYGKYSLFLEEIDYIENTIKSM